ncbi:MAG: tRNA pseudouridine(54/55) synthase Pus10 [Candidatus Aenigmarchaeota archaeon]|nr:tRNA pseudouridine(54/55) synthase Pus10 [Candidatus Aenigmarchaeota archaeon]
MIRENAIKILGEGYVCDHCLGRQFAKLLSGYSNDERGRMIRGFLAMEYEIKPFGIDTSNLYGFDFRKRETIKRKPGKCMVCRGLFDELPKLADQATKILKGLDFERFMVGVKMSDSLAMAEESLWEKAGIAYCEPIKYEINREMGKLIEKKMGKIPDENRPEVIILIDLQKRRIETSINPIYVYGEYKKLVRGIPQTRLRGYKETVEDIIARPLLMVTKGFSHKLHACGREDKQARCLDWRPFILEIDQPLKRRINLKDAEGKINKDKRIKVKGLRYSSRKEIVEMKKKRIEKVYKLIANFERPVRNITRVKKIVGVVNQKTPDRLLPRQSDKLRHKKVKSIRWKKINTKTYEFHIHTEAGLYINELVSGDKGRTKPSVSEILENQGKLKEFDVLKIIV